MTCDLLLLFVNLRISFVSAITLIECGFGRELVIRLALDM